MLRGIENLFDKTKNDKNLYVLMKIKFFTGSIENVTSTFGNLDSFLCIDTDCATDQNFEKNYNLKIENRNIKNGNPLGTVARR